MYLLTATYKGQRITRKAFGDFQAFTIINQLSRDGCTDIGMRKEKDNDGDVYSTRTEQRSEGIRIASVQAHKRDERGTEECRISDRKGKGSGGIRSKEILRC